jgi:hypothetical protein
MLARVEGGGVAYEEPAGRRDTIAFMPIRSPAGIRSQRYALKRQSISPGVESCGCE